MKVALDTNILAYAEGVNSDEKEVEAWDLIEKLPDDATIPLQALGELFQVLVRKAGRTPAEARAVVSNWSHAFPLVETTTSMLFSAIELATRQFSLWDAVILSAAAEAECQILLSEDMQTGFTWRGVTIINPFSRPAHPLLESLLRG